MIKIIKTDAEWDLWSKTGKIIDLTGKWWQDSYYYQWIRWFPGKYPISELQGGIIFQR